MLAVESAGVYPRHPEFLPGLREHGRYRTRFARSLADKDAVLRLRFEVFNRELGEGLDASWEAGRDEDPFDASCHHLMVEDEPTGQLVGTYRMQTAETAAAGLGFYSAGEFDLSKVPAGVLAQSIEVGRACILKPFRNREVLFLLWRGLARYAALNRKRYLFGCCSISTLDPGVGVAALGELAAAGRMHPEVHVEPLPGLACTAPRGETAPAEATLPILFRTYLRYGALVCGPPALDRAFGTVDFFMLLDTARMDVRHRRLYFDEVA